jgi:hypothetical protein
MFPIWTSRPPLHQTSGTAALSRIAEDVEFEGSASL